MMTIILEGHEAAKHLLGDVAAEVQVMRASAGRVPCLALLTMGSPASAMAYARRIEEYAALANVEIAHIEGPADASPMQVRDLVCDLNNNEAIDGILPLSPFPADISLAEIAAVLSPEKDVDGLTAYNVGQLSCGLEGLYPCTPQAAVLLAEGALGDLRGLKATVVGASANVGRPLAVLLLQRGVTVTVAHIDTRDLVAACKTAELLFVATGKAALINAAHIGPDITIIDIGISAMDDGQGNRTIVGDVDRKAVEGIARAISAVPDGVGPLTTAYVIGNTVRAARLRLAAASPGNLGKVIC
jgi:methylenetetrahydrofolate dehydrogenase (NADP+)/methenyltetrahydrofolate cyclohydrolase